MRIIKSGSRLAKARAAIAETGDPEKMAKLEALEAVLRKERRIGFREVTNHVLWEYRDVVYLIWMSTNMRTGAQRRSGAVLKKIRESGRFPELEKCDESVFGRWLHVAMQLVDQGLDGAADGYIAKQVDKIRKDRREARLKGKKYTYEPYAPEPIARPALHEHEREPQPAHAQAAPLPAAPTLVSRPIAQPAMPAAREASAPTKTPIRTREEIKEAFLDDLRQNDPVTYESLMAIDDLAVRDKDIWTLITAKTNAENKSRRGNEHKNLLSEIERKNLERAERRRLRETPPSA